MIRNFSEKLGKGLEQIAIKHVNSASGFCFHEPNVPSLLENTLQQNILTSDGVMQEEERQH